ncbi:hypothetical protein [Sulfuricurvum sp.]|uniref:hypothetical protein n=1 Tax=Sulfuricurvum sp. TaxID=2025608 RepID=UPI003BB12376
MADLAETETYVAGIYQLEITDPVIGGPDGIDNLQAKQLANRTNWLKAKIDSILSMSFIHTAVAENPGDTDEFGYWDSLTLSLRKVTLTNLKTVLFGSATLTGTPTAPTAPDGTNTLQLATTAFVQGPKVGTVTNNSAPAGYIGEYISSTIPAGSPAALPNNLGVNITSISLPAGDWDVRGIVLFTGAATIGMVFADINISSAARSSEAIATPMFNASYNSATYGPLSLSIPTKRVSLAATTTVYLVAFSNYSAGTAFSAFGSISARRVR